MDSMEGWHIVTLLCWPAGSAMPCQSCMTKTLAMRQDPTPSTWSTEAQRPVPVCSNIYKHRSHTALVGARMV